MTSRRERAAAAAAADRTHDLRTAMDRAARTDSIEEVCGGVHSEVESGFPTQIFFLFDSSFPVTTLPFHTGPGPDHPRRSSSACACPEGDVPLPREG